MGIIEAIQNTITREPETIRVGDVVRFHRVVKGERAEQAYTGQVTRVWEDSFGEWWLEMAYRSRRWGEQYYSVNLSTRNAFIAAGTPLVTHVARNDNWQEVA